MQNRLKWGFYCGIFCLMSFKKDPIKTSMSQVLATVKSDAKTAFSKQMPTFINELDYRLPLIQKIEFKLGADNFDLTGQQYGLAIAPNSLTQRKRQAAIKATEVNRSEAENNVLVHTALMERYQILVDIHFTSLLKEKEKLVENVLNQKNATLKSMIQRGLDVRVKDIAETENDRYTVQLALLELETHRVYNDEKLKQFMGTNNEVLINFDNLIHVADIEKNIGFIKQNKNSQTPDVVLANTEIEAKQATLNLEKATNKEILSSVQVVDAPKKNDVFNNFGVRFTLSLPLPNNNRLKRNDLAIAIKKAENKKEILLIEHQNEVKVQAVKIENLIKKYRIYADKAEHSLIKSLLDNAKLTAEMSATDVLDLKLIQQKAEIDLTKIEYDIVNEYLVLLYNTHLLVGVPFKNYLSSKNEVF
jgi:hypothetical protein